jgi:hypothetical protein
MVYRITSEEVNIPHSSSSVDKGCARSVELQA